jgi:hypothetical protein
MEADDIGPLLGDHDGQIDDLLVIQGRVGHPG